MSSLVSRWGRATRAWCHLGGPPLCPPGPPSSATSWGALSACLVRQRMANSQFIGCCMCHPFLCMRYMPVQLSRAACVEAAAALNNQSAIWPMSSGPLSMSAACDFGSAKWALVREKNGWILDVHHICQTEALSIRHT